jgi:hypothetical protein
MAATLETLHPATPNGEERYDRISTGMLPNHVLKRLLEQGRENALLESALVHIVPFFKRAEFPARISGGANLGRTVSWKYARGKFPSSSIVARSWAGWCSSG